jgi:anti-anti-sigma regulatory factor
VHGAGTSQLTLRITVHNNPDSTVIKLEGRIAGPWADELGATWCELAIPLNEKLAAVDLRDVTYVDANGMQILRQIYREKKPAFLTGSPLTESFAEQASRNTANDREND